jgi:hypothetical protein
VRGRARLGAAALVVGCATGCGSSITSEPKELLDPSQVRDDVPAVSITPRGVSPQTLHLDAPVTVTFSNDDGTAHRLEPAPELAFGDCPEMLQLGTLQPAQKGTVVLKTGGLICAYHDSAGPTDVAFKGLLVIH